MQIKFFFLSIMTAVLLLTIPPVQAGSPLWSFTPLTSTSAIVPANSSATILYRITNQSNKPHTLVMKPMQGIAQITLGTGTCGNPFVLSTKGASCTLSLQANGSQLTNSINDGPIVCEQGSSIQCYRPSSANILHIIPATPLPLPINCVTTGNNNIQCTITISGQTNYGFTNMTYALCRSAQCSYDGVQTSVSCSCLLIEAYQGIYSASVSPSTYDVSKPVGNQVTSTYSRVNSSGETPTTCPSGPFANCFGASCTVNGSSVICICPVETSPFIAPQSNCNLGGNKIWSATSVSSFSSIDGAMQFIYNNFFGGNSPQ